MRLNLTVTRPLACSLCLILLSSLCYAEIYQWRDKQGDLHFGDKPPVEAKTKTVKVKINSYDSVEIIDNDKEDDQGKEKKRSKQIVMYSTQWCGACKKAKKYFRENNITFQEYDVETSEKGRRDYDALEGNGVPIILIGKKRMNGFSASYFESIYYKK